MHWREMVLKTLESLKKLDVDYADIRISEMDSEDISTEDGCIKELLFNDSSGYGIRVLTKGAMGFAASQDFSNMHSTAIRALEIARATSLCQKTPVVLSPKPVIIDEYKTPVAIDPFATCMSTKISILTDAEAIMRNTVPQLAKTRGHLIFRKEKKTYADTEGSWIVQEIVESGGGIEAIASSSGDTQKRSYPNSFRGNFGTGGLEYIYSMNLNQNAPRVAQEAWELINAETCPSGCFDLILDGAQLMLQIHESIGHPIELDRILGHEAGFFGTSFLESSMIGYEYGSESVNVVADTTVANGLSTYGYDDEGVAAQRIPIITKGKLAGFLSSRETAGSLGIMSNGSSRADGWGRTPIVRITNVNLLPGECSLEGLIGGIERGFFFQGIKSWSIDQRRLNFQFASEIALEIKDGRLTGTVYKNPVYSGTTPEFWRSCDGLADERHWQMFGTPSCGKAEPGQTAHVGHGASPARFRRVKVGVNVV